MHRGCGWKAAKLSTRSKKLFEFIVGCPFLINPVNENGNGQAANNLLARNWINVQVDCGYIILLNADGPTLSSFS